MTKRERTLRQLARSCAAELWRTNGGHYCINGEGWKVFTSATPSDRRSMVNLKRDLRKASGVAL